MRKRCFILVISFVMCVSLCVQAFADGSNSSQGGSDPFIDSILTGPVEGDSIIVEAQGGSDSSSGGSKLKTTFQSDHGTREDPGKGWTPLGMDYKGIYIGSTEYKYKVVGDGSGPSIIYLTGSGQSRTYKSNPKNPDYWSPDRADNFLDTPEYDGYNILVVTSDANELQALAPKGANNDEKAKYTRYLSFPTASDYRSLYASRVVDLAKEKFPDSDEYLIVGHSLGGCGLDQVYKKLKDNGKKTSAAVFVEGLYYKGYPDDETSNKFLTSNLEKDGVTMLVAHTKASSDNNWNQARHSTEYLKRAKNPFAIDLNLTGKQNILFKSKTPVQHGSLMYCQELIDAIKNLLPSLDTSKKDNSSSNDVALKNNQASLKDKLAESTKKATNVVKSVKNVVSSALKSFTNAITSALKTSTGSSASSATSKTASNKTSSNSGSSTVKKPANTTASTGFSKSSGSVWNKLNEGVTSKLKNISKAVSLLS